MQINFDKLVLTEDESIHSTYEKELKDTAYSFYETLIEKITTNVDLHPHANDIHKFHSTGTDTASLRESIIIILEYLLDKNNLFLIKLNREEMMLSYVIQKTLEENNYTQEQVNFFLNFIEVEKTVDETSVEEKKYYGKLDNNTDYQESMRTDVSSYIGDVVNNQIGNSTITIAGNSSRIYASNITSNGVINNSYPSTLTENTTTTTTTISGSYLTSDMMFSTRQINELDDDFYTFSHRKDNTVAERSESIAESSLSEETYESEISLDERPDEEISSGNVLHKSKNTSNNIGKKYPTIDKIGGYFGKHLK